MLTKNEFIFRNNTDDIWRNFQKIENQLRPKFAYGFSWTEIDMENVKTCYKTIEKICLEKLGEDINE